MSVPKIPPPQSLVHEPLRHEPICHGGPISFSADEFSREKMAILVKKTLVISRNLFKIAKNDEKMTNNNH